MKKRSNILTQSLCILALIGLSNCTEKTSTPPQSQFHTDFASGVEFLNSKAPQVQEFTLDLTTSQLITSENGITYKFFPNTFRSINTQAIVNKDVKIELTEYNSKADMIFSGVTTVSNNEILESGAMFNIQASSGSQELYMSGSYQVNVPSADLKSDMQIFRGIETSGSDDQPSINWVTDTVPDSSVVIDSSQKYYQLNLSFLSWCNLDRFYNAPTGDPVRVIIPEEYVVAGTKVYMIFEERSVVGLFQVPGNEFNSGNYNIPEGWDVKFLVVAVLDGELYYGFRSSTTGPNHLEEFEELTKISEEDLDELIRNL
ncbi:hypothetical protein GYB22_05425 [bacterium]|nr:hypothetical protein [bacterium]